LKNGIQQLGRGDAEDRAPDSQRSAAEVLIEKYGKTSMQWLKKQPQTN
jgi:hypothetical protein